MKVVISAIIFIFCYSTISYINNIVPIYATTGISSLRWPSDIHSWFFMSTSEPSRNWPNRWNCVYAIESGAWYGEFISSTISSSDDTGVADIYQRPVLHKKSFDDSIILISIKIPYTMQRNYQYYKDTFMCKIVTIFNKVGMLYRFNCFCYSTIASSHGIFAKNSTSCNYPVCNGSTDYALIWTMYVGSNWDVIWSSTPIPNKNAAIFGSYGHVDLYTAANKIQSGQSIYLQRPVLY